MPKSHVNLEAKSPTNTNHFISRNSSAVSQIWCRSLGVGLSPQCSIHCVTSGGRNEYFQVYVLWWSMGVLSSSHVFSFTNITPCLFVHGFSIVHTYNCIAIMSVLLLCLFGFGLSSFCLLSSPFWLGVSVDKHYHRLTTLYAHIYVIRCMACTRRVGNWYQYSDC